MKLAIDSYCYHRYFGEWYPNIQSDPGSRMSIWNFLSRAKELDVDGVSLESCFLSWQDDRFVEELSESLQHLQLEPVWAWGHPSGLGSGGRPEELKNLYGNLDVARRIGAGVMRICGGSRHTRPAHWGQHRDALLELLLPAVEHAEKVGVILAIENHVDMLANEMAELIRLVNSPFFGVCLDTANNLRLFEDPVEVAKVLAPYAKSTHIKDIAAYRGDPRSFSFWPSVPLGEGAVDVSGILNILKSNNYQGLLALEIDYLHPKFGSEDSAVEKSISYLRKEISRHSS